MLNQTTTSYWVEAITAWPVVNLLFSWNWDDSLVWDDVKMLGDNSVGSPVYGRRLI